MLCGVRLSKNNERSEYARRCEVSTPFAAAATRASAANSAGFAIIPGKISEPARQPDRAIGHRALDHRLHRAQLIRRRIARVRAHHAQANTAMPRQMRDVEREPLALQMRSEARHVVPFPVEFPLGA